MEKLKSYTHKVQYYETDAMAIVHHSNYIRWFEEARLDYLEQIGLPYDEIESCDENSNDYIVACACMPAAVADITSFIYGFLKIGGPVLLIILGAVDLGKAIVATDESGIQKAKKKLVNKFVAAASIFLVFSIVQMIVSIVGGGDYVQQVEGNCLYYLLNGFKP